MKSTLTEQIVEELLNAVDDGNVDEVLKKYSYSKGPLYHALAQATAELEGRLYILEETSEKAMTEYEQAEAKTQTMQARVAELIAQEKKLCEHLSLYDRKTRKQEELLNCVDSLAQQGFSASHLKQLHAVLDRMANSAGEKPNQVIDRFFRGVEQYGGLQNLEKTGRGYQKRIKEMKEQAGQLAAEIASLTSQRDQVAAAIESIRKNALREIEATSKQVQQNLQTLMNKTGEVADLEFEAGVLAKEIGLVRILFSDDPAQWGTLSRYEIQRMLAGIILWSQDGDKNNITLPQPPKQLKDRMIFLSKGGINIAEVLGWILRGTLTIEDKKILASR